MWFDREVWGTLSNSVLMDLGSGSARIGVSTKQIYCDGNVVMNNVMRWWKNLSNGLWRLAKFQDTLITHNEISYASIQV